MPEEMGRLSHDLGDHVRTITVAIGAREDDYADIQRILAFVQSTGVTGRKHMRLGGDNFISEIFNDHVGQ
jgi:hypothetical protein